VFSQAAGRVASICAADRALVEYGDSLLELDLAA
jgi:biotin carboxyl carrier protein